MSHVLTHGALAYMLSWTYNTYSQPVAPKPTPRTAIIFFDGDGTLWYPRSTRRSQKPYWVYAKRSPIGHLVLAPYVRRTLRHLRRMGVTLVVLSTHPFDTARSNALLARKLVHFGLLPYFHGFSAPPTHREAKPLAMIQTLRALQLPRSSALMVGDSYLWDYRPARKHRIAALLMQSEYSPSLRLVPKRRRLKELPELVEFVIRRNRHPVETHH